MDLVKRILRPDEFEPYVRSLNLSASHFQPHKLVIHNSGAPTIKQWQGKTSQEQRLENLQAYYEGKNPPWKGAPHLFISPTHICVFNSLLRQGTHSPSWNNDSFGVEMIGDFNLEQFNSGPGLQVQTNAILACGVLCYHGRIDTGDIKLHKEDPKTDHRDCPGKNVNKAVLVQAIRNCKLELINNLGAI